MRKFENVCAKIQELDTTIKKQQNELALLQNERTNAMKKRNKMIVELAKNGTPIQTIANKCGLTRQYIHKIIRKQKVEA